MRILVIATGVLLVGKPASEHSTLLVEQRPGKRDKPWRAVPNGDVARHVEQWALAHGIRYDGEHDLGPTCTLEDKGEDP